jgi:thiol-disulfide isomerase/thioredoxin
MMQQDETQENNAMMQKKEGMTSKGVYTDHTQSVLPADILTDGKTKVLFFHAAWCPSCKKADGELTQWYESDEANGALLLYKINYDKEKDLIAKYGVTYQHTFVKVDGQGNLIEKIQSPNLDDIEKLVHP